MLKKHDLRKLGEKELKDEISNASKELFKLKLDVSSGQEKRGHLIKANKKYIAQVKTISREKEILM